MGDESTIDPKVGMANSDYIVGWYAAWLMVIREGIFPEPHEIQYIYNKRGFSTGTGFEDGANHYMSRNLDEPVNSDKEWAEFNKV